MEEIIDTGFDSLNEILVEGYSGNSNELIIADAVRRTSCRSTDCESPGTKARKCTVFTF